MTDNRRSRRTASIQADVDAEAVLLAGRTAGAGKRSGRRGKDSTLTKGEFRIGFYVHDVSRMRRTLFDQEAKPLGLTRSQWWALMQLSRMRTKESQDGVLQTELASVLDVGKVTVGGLIDRLEASGYVERRPHASDRRAKLILMTESGQRVIDEMVKIAQRLNSSIMRGIEPDEVEIAERVLARMKVNIRGLLDEAPQEA